MEATLPGSGRGKSGLRTGDGGIGGGGRLIGLADGFGREGVWTGCKRGDALGEAVLEERIGGGGGGRLEDLGSDEGADPRRTAGLCPLLWSSV